MNTIEHLTQSIRDNLEYLDYGTIKTLDMIDKESKIIAQKKDSNCDNPLLSEVRALANNGLYFNDSADCRSALWDILKKVAPDMFDEKGKLKEYLDFIELD